jgi:zinc transporter ZupT
MLHSFLEGLPVYDPLAASGVNMQLILGLAIHNLPVTIAFVMLMKEHGGGAGRSWILLLSFAIMSPLGLFFSYFLQNIGLKNYEAYSRFAYALVIGIFLHISTAILLETSVNHRYNLRKTLAMAAGIIIACLLA